MRQVESTVQPQDICRPQIKDFDPLAFPIGKQQALRRVAEGF